MENFTSVATWLQATGPYGLVAVLGWAFWRVNEKKDAQLRELFDKVAEMGRVQTEAVTKVEAALVARHAQRRLLLVEDEPINREVALDVLGECFQNVDIACDGVDAVELAARQPYDLILMDIQMPHLDGLQATRQIRALPSHAQTPIVAMTANAFAEDRAQCMAAGMNDFLSKPVEPEKLFETVLRWLER